MPFELSEILEKAGDLGGDLFATHVNPQLARVLKTIGFHKNYVRAKGPFLYDQNGEEYLDFLAGYGVFNLGRCHPVIKKALHAALDADLPNMVQMDTPPLAGLLAQELLRRVGGRTDIVFFTNSGTEAVEGALKFARKATGRKRILSLDHAFHGLTTGSLAVNGNEEFRAGFGALLPDCSRVQLGDIDELRRELSSNDVAAFVIEPIQGKGVYQADQRYYAEAEALCRAHGTFLIVDEVQTGLGRTGAWFAHHSLQLEPDIVTVSKALSGGYIPVGAICYTKDIYYRVFRNMEECVVHSNTFGRNALAMVAGLATLQTLEEEKLIENAALQGERLREGLELLKPRFEMLGKIRGQGLMVAIEFQEPKSFTLRSGWKLVHAMNKGLFGQMVVVPLMNEHRILTQVAGHNIDIVKLLPPLIIDETHVDRFLNAFEQVMIECHRFPGNAWKVGKKLAVAAATVGRKVDHNSPPL